MTVNSTLTSNIKKIVKHLNKICPNNMKILIKEDLQKKVQFNKKKNKIILPSYDEKMIDKIIRNGGI